MTTQNRIIATVVAVAGAIALAGGGVAVGNAIAPDGTASPVAAVQTVALASTAPTSSTTGVPAGATLTAYTGPTTITSCGTVIDHKIIPASLTIRATNGNTAVTNNEASAKANACVILTNDLIAPTASNCGGGCAGVDTSYSSSTACKAGGVVHPCGPLFIADSEVSMPISPSGFSYGFKETNVHGWRVYSHGTNQGANCDGYCEFHQSFLIADRVDAKGTAHMDGFSSNGNGGRAILLDGDTLSCQITNHVSLDGGGCSGDIGLFGDFDSIASVTVTGTLLKGPGDSAYCAYTGASQPSKANSTGKNLTWSNNVWERGPSNKCATYGPVADWASGNGNVSCNNQWDNGGAVIADTAGCPTAPPVTTTTVPSPTTPTTFLPPPPPTTTTVPAPTTTTVAPTTSTSLPPVTTTTVGPVTTTTGPCLRTAHNDKVCAVGG